MNKILLIIGIILISFSTAAGAEWKQLDKKTLMIELLGVFSSATEGNTKCVVRVKVIFNGFSDRMFISFYNKDGQEMPDVFPYGGRVIMKNSKGKILTAFFKKAKDYSGITFNKRRKVMFYLFESTDRARTIRMVVKDIFSPEQPKYFFTLTI